MTRDLFNYLFPSVVQAALGLLVLVPVMTYYLDPRDFGVAAILSAVAMPIGPLSSTGFSWVLSAHFYKLTEVEQRVLVFNVLLGEVVLRVFWVSVFALCAPLMLPVIVSGYEAEYLSYFYLVLATALVGGLWPAISYTVVLRQRSSHHAMLELLPWLASAITTVVCLGVLRLSTVTLFVSPLIAGLTSLIISIRYARHETIAWLRRRWLREIVGIGIPSIPANLLELLGGVSGRYFIHRWAGLGPLGIYSHAESYRSMLTMGAKAFSRTFSPSMLQAVTRNSEPINAKGMLRWWYGLLALGGVSLGLFVGDIIGLLTHGKFVAAAPLAIVWFCLVISYSFGLPYSSFLSVHQKNAFMVNSSTLISGVFIGVVAFATYAFGPVGTALAVTLSNVTVQVVRRWYACAIGCERIGETGALAVLVSTIGAYAIGAGLALSLATRLGIFVVSAIAITALTRMRRSPGPTAGEAPTAIERA